MEREEGVGFVVYTCTTPPWLVGVAVVTASGPGVRVPAGATEISMVFPVCFCVKVLNFLLSRRRA